MSKIYETYHDTVRNSFFWAGFVNDVNFIKMLQEDLNSRKKILKHVATETGAHLCKNFTEIRADCFRGNNLWYQEYTKMKNVTCVCVFVENKFENINFSCSAI